jgi:arylsulfatase A-like enzyme
VDEGVGRIVKALRRKHVLGETYIVFTSDNGYMQGEHRVRSGKMLPYDPSTRVPLIIRGPGLPEAAVSSELVANTDLAPTLLELAGAHAGKTVDGRSLLRFARNPARRSRRALLHETGGRRYASAREQDEASNLRRPVRRVMSYRAVRTQGWLYVRWHGGSRELYNLRRDPDQMHSLHAGRRHRRVRRVLARKLRKLAHCAGESCR